MESVLSRDQQLLSNLLLFEGFEMEACTPPGEVVLVTFLADNSAIEVRDEGDQYVVALYPQGEWLTDLRVRYGNPRERGATFATWADDWAEVISAVKHLALP
jgi:hypothetical protein